MKSFDAFNLSRVPLNRRMNKASEDYVSQGKSEVSTPPQTNRDPHLIYPPENRNLGTRLFRRYHDGKLDFTWAKGIVREALFKTGQGIAPTELEAVAISAIFPEIQFENLPSSIVNIKARLSSTEKSIIRKDLEKELGHNQDTKKIASGLY